MFAGMVVHEAEPAPAPSALSGFSFLHEPAPAEPPLPAHGSHDKLSSSAFSFCGGAASGSHAGAGGSDLNAEGDIEPSDSVAGTHEPGASSFSFLNGGTSGGAICGLDTRSLAERTANLHITGPQSSSSPSSTYRRQDTIGASLGGPATANLFSDLSLGVCGIGTPTTSSMPAFRNVGTLSIGTSSTPTPCATTSPGAKKVVKKTSKARKPGWASKDPEPTDSTIGLEGATLSESHGMDSPRAMETAMLRSSPDCAQLNAASAEATAAVGSATRVGATSPQQLAATAASASMERVLSAVQSSRPASFPTVDGRPNAFDSCCCCNGVHWSEASVVREMAPLNSPTGGVLGGLVPRCMTETNRAGRAAVDAPLAGPNQVCGSCTSHGTVTSDLPTLIGGGAEVVSLAGSGLLSGLTLRCPAGRPLATEGRPVRMTPLPLELAGGPPSPPPAPRHASPLESPAGDQTLSIGCCSQNVAVRATMMTTACSDGLTSGTGCSSHKSVVGGAFSNSGDCSGRFSEEHIVDSSDGSKSLTNLSVLAEMEVPSSVNTSSDVAAARHQEALGGHAVASVSSPDVAPEVDPKVDASSQSDIPSPMITQTETNSRAADVAAEVSADKMDSPVPGSTESADDVDGEQQAGPIAATERRQIQLNALRAEAQALLAQRAAMAEAAEAAAIAVREAERSQLEASNAEDFEVADALEVELATRKAEQLRREGEARALDDELGVAEAALLACCEADIAERRESLQQMERAREEGWEVVLAMRKKGRKNVSEGKERMAIERHRLSVDAQRLREDLSTLDRQERLVQAKIDTDAADQIESKKAWEVKQQETRNEIDELRRRLALLEEHDAECAAAIGQCDAKINAVRRGYDKQLSRLQLQRESLDDRLQAIESSQQELRAQAIQFQATRAQSRDSRELQLGTLRDLRRKYEAATKQCRTRQAGAEQLRRVGAQRLRWRELLQQARATSEPMHADVARLKESIQQCGAIGLAYQAERTAVRQQIAVAESRQPELLEQKQLAISARSFKEAGRLTAELKALASEETENRAREAELSSFIETNKVELHLLTAAREEAEAEATQMDLRADEMLCSELLSLLHDSTQGPQNHSSLDDDDCELKLVVAHRAALMEQAIHLRTKLGLDSSADSLMGAQSGSQCGDERPSEGLNTMVDTEEVKLGSEWNFEDESEESDDDMWEEDGDILGNDHGDEDEERSSEMACGLQPSGSVACLNADSGGILDEAAGHEEALQGELSTSISDTGSAMSPENHDRGGDECTPNSLVQHLDHETEDGTTVSAPPEVARGEGELLCRDMKTQENARENGSSEVTIDAFAAMETTVEDGTNEEVLTKEITSEAAAKGQEEAEEVVAQGATVSETEQAKTPEQHPIERIAALERRCEELNTAIDAACAEEDFDAADVLETELQAARAELSQVSQESN